MYTRWQQAALDGMHRYSERHQTRLVPRTSLIQEELEAIVVDAGSVGATPQQTLSRVLQELRRARVLQHVGRGVDLLLDRPIAVEAEDYPAAALDAAIMHEQLRIGDVVTGDVVALSRRRKGQSRLRYHTLASYKNRCGLCDVSDRNLLVASHIVRWSDDHDAQGRLSNVLCLCRMHDALFEHGYISLTDDMYVLRKPDVLSSVIRFLQNTAAKLRTPKLFPPAAAYVRRHRCRNRFDARA